MKASGKILVAVSVLALTACTAENRTALAWNEEAGGYLDDTGFGDATMNNTLVQTGERGYVLDLNRRFASEVDPMITFPFDSAALTPQARATLVRQARWIRQFPEVRFAVYGHTDLVGSEEYNYRLGLRRAQAAVNYLVSQGADRSRLKALVSYGEEQPLIVTQGRERQNRRTITEVSGFVQSHPMVLNGKYAEVVFRGYVASATPGTNIAADAVE
ncbi:OmpA family protein [Tranquillimonas alkanivorans]|uniref:Outer membrane protein OmpA n=1 Tax=Tranquillimonas alkanivorans TaxID=441119 RepID=A0A1I5M9G5_9RHOB|nr:OmpA family protein [Tranquillimonas alkanivorans]SFP06133.1 Outer membrane protein OmpA [Tranquillimonas alkanivorans]